MKIGIIGAGNIGGTLTRRCAALGHAVSVANSRGPETLRDLAAETGATAASVTEAARDRDLIVVTIPEKNVPDLPDDLFAGTGDVAGSLDESWRQQPGTPVYTTDLDADGLRRALSEASPERSPGWRATPNSPGSFIDPR